MTDEISQGSRCACSSEPTEALRCCGLRVRVPKHSDSQGTGANDQLDVLEPQVFDTDNRRRIAASLIASSRR